MTDNQQPSLDLRKCRKCGLEKPLTEFAKVYSESSRGKQYRQHTCLICYRRAHADKERRRRSENPEPYRERTRQWRKSTRDIRSAQRKARYKKLKDEVFTAYGGYECKCCGETEPTMLSLDHIQNNGSEHRRGAGMRFSFNMYMWAKAQGFPPLFQVLCFNCNRSKYFNGGVCAHQIKNGSTTIPKGSRAKRSEAQSIQILPIG